MSDGKLRTAVLGLNDGGRLLLEAAEGVELLHIHAVADKDTNLAEEVAARQGCEAYDDYRQLIIQNQLDCLLVAAPMHSCEEYVRTAMKKKFNVLKLAPAARHFEEAAEFVRLGEEEGIQFAVANPSRFAGSYSQLRKVLDGGIEQIFLMDAFCSVGDGEPGGWKTDPKLAGGGVLLQDCYRMIDQIVWNFGMPQQVYSLHTNQALDKQQRSYLTEDTAIVTMRFSDTFIGSFVTSRRAGIGPEDGFVRLYGKDKIVTAADCRLTVADGSGQVSEESQYEDDRLGCMTQALGSFARSVLSPDKNALCSSGRENLGNMAVMEAAYLSARTGFPEEPEKILQMDSLGAGSTAGI